MDLTEDEIKFIASWIKIHLDYRRKRSEIAEELFRVEPMSENECLFGSFADKKEIS